MHPGCYVSVPLFDYSVLEMKNQLISFYFMNLYPTTTKLRACYCKVVSCVYLTLEIILPFVFFLMCLRVLKKCNIQKLCLELKKVQLSFLVEC